MFSDISLTVEVQQPKYDFLDDFKISNDKDPITSPSIS